MGDAEADFHAFAVTRAPALARSAYLLTGDHKRAEDLVRVALSRGRPVAQERLRWGSSGPVSHLWRRRSR